MVDHTSLYILKRRIGMDRVRMIIKGEFIVLGSGKVVQLIKCLTYKYQNSILDSQHNHKISMVDEFSLLLMSLLVLSDMRSS